MQRLVEEPESELVAKALQEVLTGASFRSSQQCQALLRYIVENSVTHRDEMLRERMIGANVFGRALDYDTGNDPVVRSRAAEVRKRLALHYMQHSDACDGIRIEIPIGSYRAVFERSETGGLRSADSISGTDTPASGNFPRDGRVEDRANHEGDPLPLVEDSAARPIIRSQPTSFEKVRSRWPSRLILGALAVMVLMGAGLLTVRQVQVRHRRMFESFWSPIMSTSQPVLIFIGARHKYGLSKDFLQRYRSQNHLEDAGSEFFIDLSKGETINESELVPADDLIGFGDVAAAARMSSMLTTFNKTYDLRYGSDIAVTDLQSSPAILIGGFSNVWTLEVMHQLPFRLERGDRIVDTGDEARIWIRKSDPKTFTGDDYAVVSRLKRAETGNFVIAIAGIDTYGNQASADFISDPERLSVVLRNLPQGWEQKDMQIVLHTTVVTHVPTVVNVEAVKVW